MSTSANDGKVALAMARDELSHEHAAIRGLLDDLRAKAASPKDAKPLLSDLHRTLAKHFAHETYPGGFYEAIGACKTEFLGDLRVLVDEHFLLLSTTQSLRERAERGAADEDAFGQDITGLLERLASHEQREHQLVEKALGG